MTQKKNRPTPTTRGRNKKITIIDADPFVFAVASRNQIVDGEGNTYPTATVKDCLLELRFRFEEVEEQTYGDTSVVLLSHPDNWRKELYSDYKGNRKGKTRPCLLEPIRQALMEDFTAMAVHMEPRLEADDLCGIMSTYMQENRAGIGTIVSVDKDMRTIPGFYWNPRPTKSGGFCPIETITPIDAFHYHMLQTLSGDTVDNYKGARGIGKVKAQKFIKDNEDLRDRDLWAKVVDIYAAQGHEDPEADALMNAQLAFILHNTHWDNDTKEVTLWAPPT